MYDMDIEVHSSVSRGELSNVLCCVQYTHSKNWGLQIRFDLSDCLKLFS
jgi:hypothetical protein